ERRVQPIGEDDRQIAERGLGTRDDRERLGLAGRGGRVHARGVVDAERLSEKSAGRERLATTVATASAARALERDREMTDLAGEVARRCSHRCEGRPRAFADRGDDVRRSAPRRGALVAREDARYRLLVARDDAADIRGAEIEAEKEAQTLGSLPASSGICRAV